MMRKIIFTAAIAGALFGSAGSTLAVHPHTLTTPGTDVVNIARGQTANDGNGCHQFHAHVHKGVPDDNPSGQGAFDPGQGAFQLPNNPVSLAGAQLIPCP